MLNRNYPQVVKTMQRLVLAHHAWLNPLGRIPSKHPHTSPKWQKFVVGTSSARPGRVFLVLQGKLVNFNSFLLSPAKHVCVCVCFICSKPHKKLDRLGESPKEAVGTPQTMAGRLAGALALRDGGLLGQACAFLPMTSQPFRLVRRSLQVFLLWRSVGWLILCFHLAHKVLLGPSVLMS